MSEFGSLTLLAEGAPPDVIRAVATGVSADLLIVTERPAAIGTAESLLRSTRHLPTEYVTVGIDDARLQNASDEWTDNAAYYSSQLVPLLLAHTNVIVVAPTTVLDTIAGSVDPAHLESISMTGWVTFTFDRWMNPHARR